MPSTDAPATVEFQFAIPATMFPPKRPRNNFEYRTNQLAMDLRYGRLRRQARAKKGK